MNRWNRLLSTLFVDSFKDLLKYKSFILLILVVSLIDKGMKFVLPKATVWAGKVEKNSALSDLARYVFDQLPEDFLHVIIDWRVPILILASFIVKEMLSLWPSSDMRRMHRQERTGFGLLGSLKAIRWWQFVWDALAVLTVCAILASWIVLWFILFKGLYGLFDTPACVIAFILTASAPLPLGMAAFSYSSKLAVLSQGSFTNKFGLYLKLFYDKTILPISWLFYTLRALLEVLVLGIIPAATHRYIEYALLRILITSVIACPVYSYLKMVSFKLFLSLYKRFPIVHEEYKEYYKGL